MARGQFQTLRSAMPGVEAVVAQSQHSFPRHTHEQFGIGVIHSGAQKSLSGRGTVEAGPGATITVNPGEVHDGAPIGDAGRCWRMLYFDPAIVARALLDISEGRASTGEFSLPVIDSPQVAGRFLGLFAALTEEEEGGEALRQEELLLALLATVMEERDRGACSEAIPQAVQQAKSLIDDDPVAPVSLAELATVSGLSKFRLLRSFARATGLTPHAYRVQRRIDRARRLIAEGVPLAEAAVASGFADQSHMTRVFSAKYGYSPGAYAAALT